MPRQKHFYPAVAEWLGETVEEVEARTEGMTETQVFEALAKNYKNFQEFVNQEDFIADYVNVLVKADFVPGWTFVQYENYILENGLSLADIAEHYNSNKDKENIKEAIEEEVDPVAPPVKTFTLAKAMEMEELPDTYKIDLATKYVPELEVSKYADEYQSVVAMLDGAQNAEDLDVEELFAWTIKDSSENILAAAEEEAVEDADSLTLTDSVEDELELAVAEYEVLLDAENLQDYKRVGTGSLS